jgi:hypothetical protein
VPRDLAASVRLADQLIRRINGATASLDDTGSPDTLEMMFSKGELGGLIMSGDDAVQYRRALDALCAAAGTQISRSAVEDHFQKAILRALDIHSLDGERDFRRRAAREAQLLRDALSATPVAWTVMFPVPALAVVGKPIRIGRARLIPATKGRLAHLLKKVADKIRENEVHSAAEKASLIEQHQTIVRQRFENRVFAEVDSLAVDDEAARLDGAAHVALVRDVLDFYYDIAHPVAALRFRDSSSEALAFQDDRGAMHLYGLGFGYPPLTLEDLHRK